MPSTVSAALGHRDDLGRPLVETLVEQLGDQDLFVLLDNCEHLLGAIAEFVRSGCWFSCLG